MRAALDDLDTPRALAAIDEAIDRGESIGDAAGLLGVDLSAPAQLADGVRESS